ncbi:MAG: protein kinase [Polyangiaceae bacterium]
MSDAKPCPDERELYELARGTISSGRGEAVRDHIGDCAACRSVVAGLASSGTHTRAQAGEGEPSRYELQRLLGAGGMGEVFLAHDRVLDRPVALKLLHEDGAAADSRSLERVSREARALASLSDPNVVAVYDQGVLDGRPFLAMEYVRGKTLRHWLAAGPHALERVVDVLAQAGRGLAAAHAIGVVHRDFKPDNVLVGDDGRARVTDFGLARGMAEPALTVVTDVAVSGTPAYVSPERLAGTPADARSDQYAFCVAAYEALHGKRPPAGAISGASRRRGDPRLARLDAVLARGLAPSPAHRFASMRDLLAAMEAASRTRGASVSAIASSWAPAGIAAVFAATIGILAAVHKEPAAAGPPAALHGPCFAADDCPTPLVCLHFEGNFCGAAGTPGTCGWPADGCNAKSTPVCGCDGQYYENQCEAHLQRASTAYRGACVECTAGEACPDVPTGKRTPAFCHVDARADSRPGGEPPRGVCLPRPGACLAQGTPSPVCGWDGRTYASACEARLAGVDAAREGPCPPTTTPHPLDVPTEATLAPGGLAMGFPDEQGMDARPLMRLADWIEREKLPIFSLLVSRNGVLVYELYTSSLTRDEAHYLMAATEVVTSALVGAAIDRHLVGPPETSVADALPAKVFPGAASRERFRPVTIGDVLAMSAVEQATPPRDSSDTAKKRQKEFTKSPNRARFALAQSVVSKPGATFQVTDYTPMIAAAIVEYATGKTALDLANEWLFGPMGFEHVEWMHEDRAGLDSGGYGLRLRPIDMQKLGVLYLRQGEWEGKRLLSREWALRSFTPWIKSSGRRAEPDYGWYWWAYNYGEQIPGPSRPARSWLAHQSSGWKGQRIAVIPAQGLVVTMTGDIEPPLDEGDLFRRIMTEFVVASIEGTAGEPAHPDASLREELAATLERVRKEPLPLDHPLEARMVPSVEPKGKHWPFRGD